MKIIKLDTIDSTNSFLRDLSQNSTLENFTTVVAKNQLKGKGQLNSKWLSKPGKNLTFSVFIHFNHLKITQKKYLNFAISLAIYEVLFDKKIPKLSIKWPNDILSATKKICGILIENTFKGVHIKNTIVGIGLNVNQEIFSEALNNVTSLKLETLVEYNLDKLLHTILIKIQEKIDLLTSKGFLLLEKQYIEVLYKKNTPTMFKNSKGDIFIGMISGISNSGNLLVKLENDSVEEFGIKEISFL